MLKERVSAVSEYMDKELYNAKGDNEKRRKP